MCGLRERPKMSDEFLVWILSGVIGSTIKNIFDLVMLSLKISNFHIIQIAADIFMNAPDIYSIKGVIIGIIADLIIGGVFGVGLGLLFKITGTDYYFLKGWVLGLIVWLVAIGGLMHIFSYIFVKVLSEFNDLAVSMTAHSIYGIVTAYWIMKLTRNGTAVKRS